jgi:hypothetical protein
MKDPGELRSDLVDTLRDIPALVASLDNDAENIVEYVEEENGDLFNTIFQLVAPKILVVYQGSRPSGGAIPMWAHDYGLILRTTGSPTALFAAIINGVPASGGGLTFMQYQIDPAYESTSIPTLRRAVVPVGENSSRDYWELSLTYQSRGFE